jgi:hypothetical protein
VDKSTLLMAEQVGIFLAPMMREMIASAFKQFDFTTRLAPVLDEQKTFAERLAGFDARLIEAHHQMTAGVKLLQGYCEKLEDALSQAAMAENLEQMQKAHATLAASVSETQTQVGQNIQAIDKSVRECAKGIGSLSAELSELRDSVAANVEATDVSASALRKQMEENAVAVAKQFAESSAGIEALKEAYENTHEAIERNTANLLIQHQALEDKLAAEVARVEAVKSAPVELPRPPTVEQIVVACREPMLEEVRDAVQHAVAALPKAKDGDPGPVGLMPVAENYIEGRIYERGSVVLYAGGAWQATRPTKSAPAATLADWQALAVGVSTLAVQAGPDARTVELAVVLSDGTKATAETTLPTMVYRGVFDTGRTYAPGDVVTQDGSLWHTDKGCVGHVPTQSPDVWKLIVKAGKNGNRGKDGADGVQFKAGYAGEYEEDKVYPQNSIVTYASSVWMSKRPTKDRPPYVTGQDNEHWLRVR